MKPDYYAIISRAIEEGIQFGLNRAYKHTDTPSREEIADALETAILDQLCEFIRFESFVDAE